VLLLKQIIYEVSIQQSNHIGAYSVAAQQSQQESQDSSYVQKKIKTLVFSLNDSDDNAEMKANIVGYLRNAISDTF